MRCALCDIVTNLEIPVSNVNHYQLNYVQFVISRFCCAVSRETETWFFLQY
jgi:hypothetical protein